ncbi:MAG: cytochrome c oxidase accessory protein CcoG [Gemmatimonadetes bacterium]|nr:cytochrome c oxidase accessory protein CcoG [Gemmatimonadota bacterium]
MTAPAAASGRVLATLNEDGSRRWIRPKPSPGKWLIRRRAVAYALIALFLAIPHLRMNGKPWMLLDLPHRQFTFFGTTFLPTDTLLLMLLFVSALIGIFLLTALFGRVWCGWGCPQTVWMEFIFRPIERLVEGGFNASRALDRDRKHFAPRRLLKYAIYALLSLTLGNTFLAYFVGTDTLWVWVLSSPFDHLTGFLVMAVTATAVFLDFTWFREQTCLVACPYGRWQSALLDRQSLIVAYDSARGEPRGHGTGARTGLGDCIACNACVQTCPTGIDIRDGLQMECIHCTQCSDACDEIMVKVGKPVGLIRYSSKDALVGNPPRILRARTVLYPLAFTLFFGGFLFALATRSPADVTLLGGQGAPFTQEADGQVVNQVRIKVANRTGDDHLYTITYLDAEGARLIAPENPVRVPAAGNITTTVFVVQAADRFVNGERLVRFRLSDGGTFTREFGWRLLGPQK